MERFVELVGRDAADQLIRFLHDRQVSCHIHVEYFDVAEHSDRLNHLVFYMSSRRHIKTFSECSCDGRRREEYYMLVGIRNCIPYIVNIALLIQRAYRTCDDTLAAAYAGRRIQALVERRADAYVEASSDLADRADPLHVVTGGDAAQTLDTFVVVTYDIRSGIIDLILRLVVLEMIFVNSVVIREFLEFAVISSHAGQTFLVVRGKDQLDRGLSGCTNSSCIGENFQALFYRIGTCSCKTASSLDLDHTDTAGADAVDVLEVAE